MHLSVHLRAHSTFSHQEKWEQNGELILLS